MSKKQSIIAEVNKASKDKILLVMGNIVANELSKRLNVSCNPYCRQRAMLNSLFSSSQYDQENIILRLTVLDSLYSTNAKQFNYFVFDDMAYAILELGSREAAREYFYSIACGGTDTKTLFSKKYGKRKNFDDGQKQISLLSKYAYYELLQDRTKYPLGFPIYDSLVQELYPIVCHFLSVKSIGSPNTQQIEKYVKCLNHLRGCLWDNESLLNDCIQQFDILDAYSWRMGKYNVGNLSLLLGQDDYELFVNNNSLSNVTKDFDIKVRLKLANPYGQQPFKGCTERKHLTLLLNHWRLLMSHGGYRSVLRKYLRKSPKHPLMLVFSDNNELKNCNRWLQENYQCVESTGEILVGTKMPFADEISQVEQIVVFCLNEEQFAEIDAQHILSLISQQNKHFVFLIDANEFGVINQNSELHGFDIHFIAK